MKKVGYNPINHILDKSLALIKSAKDIITKKIIPPTSDGNELHQISLENVVGELSM